MTLAEDDTPEGRGAALPGWARALPGWELIGPGLRDLAAGDDGTVEALLVAVGSPRLRELGLELPPSLPDAPEARLYELLSAEHGDDSHGQYNALIRRLVSFERAAPNAPTR